MELMQASFDGVFPDIPLPNLGSGLSRIHVDATCLPASGGALRVPHSRDLTRLFCTRLLPQGSPFGSTFGGYNSTIPWSRFRALVVTFSLFNSFNAASHDLSNSQCKFWDQGISSHPQSLLSSQEWAAKPAPKAVSHRLRAGVFKASCRATRTLGLLMFP